MNSIQILVTLAMGYLLAWQHVAIRTVWSPRKKADPTKPKTVQGIKLFLLITLLLEVALAWWMLA